MTALTAGWTMIAAMALIAATGTRRPAAMTVFWLLCAGVFAAGLAIRMSR